jgi:hypothetical protein
VASAFERGLLSWLGVKYQEPRRLTRMQASRGPHPFTQDPNATGARVCVCGGWSGHPSHSTRERPPLPPADIETEALMNELADDATARTARRELRQDVMTAAADPEPETAAQEPVQPDVAETKPDLKQPEEPEEPELPPGVLGYAVGVFTSGACTGFTHTGLMSLKSARWEARQYSATGRFRPVEIRELSGD